MKNHNLIMVEEGSKRKPGLCSKIWRLTTGTWVGYPGTFTGGHEHVCGKASGADDKTAVLFPTGIKWKCGWNQAFFWRRTSSQSSPRFERANGTLVTTRRIHGCWRASWRTNLWYSHQFLLLVDNTPSYPMAMEDWPANIEIMFLPPKTTVMLLGQWVAQACVFDFSGFKESCNILNNADSWFDASCSNPNHLHMIIIRKRRT